MIKNLVIVESPAKAKTIEGYLGKDFVVKSSFGHVRDLPKDNNAIDIENGFKPTYVISSDKKEVVAQLRKLAKEAETVWLASDDDREGEAISWHLTEALNLNDTKIRRIVFREITKNAIVNAINSPRSIDMDLVNAQQARRILDRLVGFELSPVLWKKIKTGLSAGRVQSVAVRLVVEREREIEKFKSEATFRITASFDVQGKTLEAELPTKYKTEEEAQAFLEKCIGAAYTIENLEKKPLKRSPAPPFTTSTLQQEASRKLYFSVAQTMTVAQRLYEAGKISYMRTDSVNLSEEAIQGASNAIQNSFGEKYVKTRRFKTKSASAQEAHEAIRPTDFSQLTASSDRNEQRLYELIWKRAIASQMADAEIEKTTATIGISTQPEKLIATGEVIKFEGFLKVYIESKDDDEATDDDVKGMLPPISVGQTISLRQMLATQRYSRPSARYTEASLVKKLEEMGIGRPSTYAPTISTIQKRGYVEKDSREGKERPYRVLTLKQDQLSSQTKTEITGAEKAKLFPTDMAMVVNDFLVEHFPTVIDYSFTAKVEAEFDEIAQGNEEWKSMLDKFYGKFHARIESSETINRADVSGARELGVDPVSGEKLIAKLGRFGPYVQLGEENPETGKKPAYASLRKGQFLESITIEDALELFKLPRIVGMYEDKEMKAAIGRFGPYISHNSKFYSLPKHLDPMLVTPEEAIELIEQKRKAEAEKLIKSFDENPDVQVLNGRYGPYIVVGKKNVKIPKGKEPAELTLQECLDLAEATPDKKGKGGFKKKADTATTEKKPAAKKAPSKKATAKPKAAAKPKAKK
ncbi:type I DNA topoisomerase [Pontibacter sp. BT310]|uniref:DNA topoisomerase 1 n=1 Tax=Pontibacter populi TaxID=890055 RepID=A0ABS6XEX3_9BACT|nr:MULTISPECIES: type I DNA topoisomerase [Pontibacter]MBJ6119686.1 type I DNA topoisomerase [Pontibacter sp. BT310]MBR0572115.1 type I DNA topoisomerase [Microvirga sp. STS03]MBW3366539.1 type I DNA topoisomerase [Pontibacter populi]